MAEREKGWVPYTEISGNGTVSWHEIKQMESITRPSAPQTQEVRTINNRGQLETELTAIDGSFEINGWYSTDNFSNSIMENSHKQLAEVYLKFYPNRDKVEDYIIAKCVISDYSTEYVADDLAKWSATFSVVGKPQLVGDVG